MSFEDILKNHAPQENEDADGFEILKGTYECSITKLSIGETKQEPKQKTYKLELGVSEVLDGNGSAGRKFWRTYLPGDEESAKKFINDLHTAGLSLPKTSIEDFESAFIFCKDKKVFVRAWGWTPDKKQDGTPIPPHERVPQQFFKIVAQPIVKTKEKKAGDVPF